MSDEAATAGSAAVATGDATTSDGSHGDLPIRFPSAEGVGRPGPNWASIGIFIILSLGAIALARDFLMPITMGVLLFFVCTPLRRRLGRRGIPAWVVASLVSGALIGFLVMLMAMLSGPAGQLIADAPSIIERLDQKFSDLKHQFKGLEDAATTLTGTGAATGTQPEQKPAAAQAGEAVVQGVLWFTPTLIGQFVFVVVFLFFLITSGDLLYLKIVQSFDTIGDKRRAYLALRQIEDSLGSYLGTITLINAALGVGIGIAFWLLGMPAPLLFGLAAGLLNFVPYVGAIMGAGLSTAVALVSMDGFAMPAMVGASYVVLNGIEGQVVTPYFLSRKLELNTVVVFVAVALWAWLWSIVGMIVAVPILVVMRVLFEQIPGMEKIANFLAGEDAPPVPEEEVPPAVAEGQQT